MKNWYYFVGVITLIFISCKKENHTIIDPVLKQYVNRFYEEAELRGIELSKNNLEVIFKNLKEEGVCGLGFFQYEGTNLRRVEISPEPFCWDLRNDVAKENVVFHELGHAVLKRPHLNDKLPNGLPANMMCGSGVCDNFSVYSQYTLGKRTYYLDKLFNSAAAIPAWGKIKRKESIFLVKDFEKEFIKGSFSISDPAFAANYEQKVFFDATLNSKVIQLTSKSKMDNKVAASWSNTFERPNIEEGTALLIKVHIGTQDMKGEGVALTLKTYSGSENEPSLSANISTRRLYKITNTLPFQEYLLELPYFPSNVQRMEIDFKLLPNTAGIAYFDDLQLLVLE